MRTRVSDTTSLAVASVITGVLAYVFFALTTRSLGPTAAAPVSVLWTYWTFAAAALSFPIQHWVAHNAAAHGGRGPIARAMPHVRLVVGVVAVLAGAVSALFRQQLFHNDSLWYPALVVMVTIGAAFIGLVRGGLAAQHRFLSLSATLIGENAFRCAAAVVLILLGDPVPETYGLVLVVGSFVGLFWPSAYLMSHDGSGHVASLRFLGGAASGQLIGQVVLTSGPVVLAFTGGSAAQMTSLFAGLALFRAPYQMVLAMVAKLTGQLTQLHVRGAIVALRRFRHAVIAATIVAVPLGAVVGYFLGPPLLPLIFGSGVSLSAPVCAVVAAASTLALSNLVVSVMLLASNRSGAVATGWVVAAVAGLAFAVFAWPAPLERTVIGFALAEVIAVVALLYQESLPA